MKKGTDIDLATSNGLAAKFNTKTDSEKEKLRRINDREKNFRKHCITVKTFHKLNI